MTDTQGLPDTLEELLNGGFSAPLSMDVLTRLLERKARRLGTPLHGMFELTPRCNLNCAMCYVHLDDAQLGGRALLTAEQWKMLMCRAAQAGMLDATLTGGEALTRPDFDEIYLYLHALGVQLTLLSNGLLLTPERIRFFKAHPLKKLQITLYGSDEAEYEAVTGRRVFGRVMEAVWRARAAQLPVCIAITPNRFLKDGGEALVRLVAGLGIPFGINAGLLAPRAETGRADAAIDPEEDNYLKLQLLRLRLAGVTPVSVPAAVLPPVAERAAETARGLRCSAGRSGFSISWDGWMSPCGAMREILADPIRTGFSSAWRSVRAQAGRYPLPSECEGCAYARICPSCVMLHARDVPPGHASPRVCRRGREMVRLGLISPGSGDAEGALSRTKSANGHPEEEK